MTISKKKVTGAFLGTIVEYYDYSLYGFSAGILAKKFFPEVEHMIGLMYVFAVYAVSYWAKPLGALFFSRIGDKYGRKVSLRITMLGIAVPTFIIGLLPEYQNAGMLTTEILVICRFFQGFFVAGEYDGAAIYIIEHLSKKYQYTASAITRAAGVMGLLFGIAVTNFFNSSIFPEWCWRLPFLLSLPLAGITMYYRKFLEETPDFVDAQKQSIKFYKLFEFVRRRIKLLFLIVILSGGFGVTYQISIIFMKQYLPMIIPESQNIIRTFSIIIVLMFGATMPIAGICADYYGEKMVFRYSLFLVLISASLFLLAAKLQLLNLALFACILMSISVAPFNSLAHGVVIKLFNSRERYRAISLGHTIGSLLMSGTANYVCLFFMNKYGLTFFPIYYFTTLSIISYIVIRVLSSHQER